MMVGLWLLLAAPAFAARVQEHQQHEIFSHLGEEDSLAAAEALEILEKLKADANNAELQDEYRAAIGDIEWEEDRSFLESGAHSASAQPAVMIGQASQPGNTLTLAELLRGRLGHFFSTSFGRLFLGRRDFAVEQESGETKYMIDGITESLHSRMQITFPDEPQPRFVVRRAFNYFNPIARTIGQFVYRVVRCAPDNEEGWAGKCEEGDILYTITKDRLGQGTWWGQDEYRVYTGTGGCRRWGHGLLSCRQSLQVMYSLSAGLFDGSHDTTFYAGNILEILPGSHSDSGRDTGRLYHGEELDEDTLESMKVATVSKVAGSPRPLNWPMRPAVWLGQRAIMVAYSTVGSLGATLTDAQRLLLEQETVLTGFKRLEAIRAVATPAQESLLATLSASSQMAGQAYGFLYAYALAYHLAKSLIWADAYHVTFVGNPADELLVSVVAGIQDIVREQIALRPATR